MSKSKSTPKQKKTFHMKAEEIKKIITFLKIIKIKPKIEIKPYLDNQPSPKLAY